MPALKDKLREGLATRQPARIPDPHLSGVGSAIMKSTMRFSADRVYDVPIKDIRDNPFQFRSELSLNASELESLAKSIQAEGLRTPLLLRMCGEELVLVAGWRRLTAIKRFVPSMTTVKATLDSQMDDAQHQRITIIENEQRQDFTLVEKAEAYKTLIENQGMTHEKLAEVVGRARSFITLTLKLAELPSDLKALFADASGKGMPDAYIHELGMAYDKLGADEKAADWVSQIVRRILAGEDIGRTDIRAAIREAEASMASGRKGDPKKRKPVKTYRITGGEWKRFEVSRQNNVVLEFKLPESYEYNDKASIVRYIKGKLLGGTSKG